MNEILLFCKQRPGGYNLCLLWYDVMYAANQISGHKQPLWQLQTGVGRALMLEKHQSTADALKIVMMID